MPGIQFCLPLLPFLQQRLAARLEGAGQQTKEFQCFRGQDFSKFRRNWGKDVNARVHGI